MIKGREKESFSIVNYGKMDCVLPNFEILSMHNNDYHKDSNFFKNLYFQSKISLKNKNLPIINSSNFKYFC